MPPREVRGINDRGAADWYWALPPLTRALLTCYLVTGLSAYLGILPIKQIFHLWTLYWKPFPQIWRLVTNFAFIGKPSLPWLFQLVWLVTYGGSYEAAKFASNTADGIVMLGVGMITTMCLDLFSFLGARFIPPVFFSYFHGGALVFMFLYLWSKQNPEAQVSLFGIIKLNGKHLPFGFLMVDLLMGGDIWTDITGILAGHMYWFLTEAYPMATGRTIIRTPQWLSRLCLQYGIGRVPIQAVNPVNPSDVRFRAFQGRARRLNE